MEYAQRIGARIARLRTEKHLTQGQLAQAAGVPRDALARWEAGGGLPGRAELTALARPLGTTAAALLNADEDEPDEAPVGFLTFPRTEQAWRAQARCMRGSGPRTAYALAALCCTVCAAFSRSGPPAKEILRPFRQPYTPPTAAGIKTENLTGWSTPT